MKMKKPIRILLCLIAPLHSANILFLAKQRKAYLALPLIRLNLWLCQSTSLEAVEAIQDSGEVPPSFRLPEDLVRALICLGFIRFGSAMRGTIKSDDVIDVERHDDERYSPGVPRPDRKLEAMIGGRSVAIVGPSKGADNAAEIDSYDVVIRVGYSGPDSFPENTGSRCDVAFYAPHKMKRLVSGGGTGVLRDLKLVVIFKLRRYPKLGIRISDLGVEEARLCEALLPSFRRTTANTLVKVLYNCLINGPRAIKVFNADLFLSTQYPKGYLANKRVVSGGSSWSHDKKSKCKSFAITHDPAEQLEFYKHFYRRGDFEADERLSEIIEMPIDEYMKQLDALYGAPLRSQFGLERGRHQ